MSYDIENALDQIEYELRRSVMGAYRHRTAPIDSEPVVELVVPARLIGAIIYNYRRRCATEEPAPLPDYPYKLEDSHAIALRCWEEAGVERKILAIKQFRNYTGAGLKESKDAIEAVQDEAKRLYPVDWDAPSHLDFESRTYAGAHWRLVRGAPSIDPSNSLTDGAWQCDRCHATVSEIADGADSKLPTTIVFHLPCGCRAHGDHAACDLYCWDYSYGPGDCKGEHFKHECRHYVGIEITDGTSRVLVW